MNRISVTEGKAPEKSGEIFLDCIFAESNGYKVGDQITLKEGGGSELLKKTDYTVVGLGESPLYISYNRGNSTLGSGEVNGFAYVPVSYTHLSFPTSDSDSLYSSFTVNTVAE